MVYDPFVKWKATRSRAALGDQAVGTDWEPTPLTIESDEAIEIYALEIVPPVDVAAGKIQALKASITVDGRPIETVNIHGLMAPAYHHTTISKAVNFGTPLLWRPILKFDPTLPNVQALLACPKIREGRKVSVRVKALETVTADYAVILKYARVRTDAVLRGVVGMGTLPIRLALARLEELRPPDVYVKAAVTVSIEEWEKLPGGVDQAAPKVLPWVTYSTNAVATTPNEWYYLSYPPTATTGVPEIWQELFWDLREKREAYVLTHIAVWPHDNLRDVRFYYSGRAVLPEYPTRPLPHENCFIPPQYSDITLNEKLRQPGPFQLPTPVLFHGITCGVQIRDIGTSIPAGAIMVGAWGSKLELG